VGFAALSPPYEYTKQKGPRERPPSNLVFAAGSEIHPATEVGLARLRHLKKSVGMDLKVHSDHAAGRPKSAKPISESLRSPGGGKTKGAA
jgi:hypothetical protein